MSDHVEEGVHATSNPYGYVYPEEPAVREALRRFTGYKLGFMMHWAPGCQIASYESWPLSDEDWAWSQEDVYWTDDIEQFKREYLAMPETFNPIKFRPDLWAQLAKSCGFKYLLFTTKHHDGFCMWDTATTDYKITHPAYPFSHHPYADIVGALFDAFRDEGLAISAYFSKPDWHSPYYWAPQFGTAPTRNVNYDPAEHPELWQRFVDESHAQMMELIEDYGPVDCLWLDGGWVRSSNLHQDLKLDELVAKARKVKPDLLVVDRTVGEKHENLLTPEQAVPDRPIEVPWETCISLGKRFSFHYEDVYKSAETLVHLFIDILSKGGNLALNLTPQPNGELPRAAVHRLRRFGLWVQQHADAIYESQRSPLKPGRHVKYTAKDGRDYAFFLYDTYPYLPPRIPLGATGEVTGIRHLRSGCEMRYEQTADDQVILYPRDVPMLGAEYAECFELRYD